jgi:hypothetical protein
MKRFLSVVITVCFALPTVVIAPPPPVVAAEPKRWFDGLKDLLPLLIPTGVIVLYIDAKSQLAAKDVEILKNDVREGFSAMAGRIDAMTGRIDTLIQDHKSDRQTFEERLFKLAMAHNPNILLSPTPKDEQEG